ncbi:MAG: molecular chaperone DnaJ [Chloroflexi bacterium]|nr:MAG: molecular chaperone DnaJ [Chloroflexota bacterium]
MVVKKDYYRVLGLSPGASLEDIKRAFRRLAFECHPDRNRQHGAEDRFKEINEAYQVLSDPEKRARYDQRSYSYSGRGFDGFDDFVSGLGDIFEAFFAGSAPTGVRTRVPKRGANLHHSTSITLEEAAFGCEKVIDITRTENCSHCYGHGGEPGSELVRCPACNGAGEVRRVHHSLFGRFVNRVVCEQCYGSGSIVSQPCNECGGTGKQRRKRKITVKIPAGVEEGSQIRLRGEGDAGEWGGPAGDLYITLSITEHSNFKREGDDIFFELPVNFAQAALGDEVEIPTLDGTARMRIEPGTQAGEVIRLKGKGVPHLNRSGRGDQLVTIRLVTPESLSPEQRRLFVELSRTLGKPDHAKDNGKGLFRRVRK